MEEYVLKGNSAILKCHIPSFVSEYVNVISWIIIEDDDELEVELNSVENVEGTSYFDHFIIFISSLEILFVNRYRKFITCRLKTIWVNIIRFR